MAGAAEVARACGVSRMTVSNAFNRPDQLSVALREQILVTAERLGYAGPDPVARALRRGTSDVVGVVLTSDLPYAFSDPGSTAFLLGVTTAAADAGVSVQLISAARGDVAQRVQHAAVDGVIVFGGRGRDAAVDAALRRNLPVVVAAGARVRGVPSVSVDNRAGAAEAAEHAHSRGHRDVAVVGELVRGGALEQVPDTRLRTAQFGAAVERIRGFRTVFDAAPLWQAEGNSVADGRAAGLAILPTRPSAILAVTDVLAIGVLQAAAELGLRVGHDLAVTGFDDIDEAARSSPPLTTVHQDLYAHGVDAVRRLDPDAPPERHATHLVVRTSTTGEPA